MILILLLLFLPVFFIVFNALLFSIIPYTNSQNADRNVLLINLLIIVCLVFFNIKISFLYLFLTFIFTILFIA